jgi:hypothetical protein
MLATRHELSRTDKVNHFPKTLLLAVACDRQALIRHVGLDLQHLAPQLYKLWGA